jgi:hypothetical protein
MTYHRTCNVIHSGQDITAHQLRPLQHLNKDNKNTGIMAADRLSQSVATRQLSSRGLPSYLPAQKARSSKSEAPGHISGAGDPDPHPSRNFD